MGKINIAELLKDCPQGMELDCMMYDNIVFAGIQDCIYPIKIKIKNTEKYLYLTKYGCSSENKNAKCVIFPKGKSTWNGFQRPFKDGDVLVHTQNKRFVISIFGSISSDKLVKKVDETIEKVLDEVLFLQNGRIVLSGAVDDIRAEHGKSIDGLFREVFRC